ncbi:hypothetical protein BJ166DRAFT_590874 [Pestalotiopsis sp. NC0098]|nr:hypothetical protein BJ166DRAFT_590874 [Pestalotiopsis sp. NC0098]
MYLTTAASYVFIAYLTQALTAESAATTQTSSSVVSFLLPSRSTSAGYHVYASPITSDATTTQYLLACQSQFAAIPHSCEGDFSSLTLTYGPKTMHLNLGPSVGLEYDCQLSPAVCTVTSSGIVATSTVVTLAAGETSQSMTPVTVLMVTTSTSSSSSSTSRTTTATATTSDGGKVCKRKAKTTSSVDGGGDDDSGCSSSSSPSSGAAGRIEVGLVLFGATAVAALVGVVIL